MEEPTRTLGGIWYVATRPKTPGAEILARSGLHWHPKLTITVNGERLLIPEGIGLGATHQSIHTHDDSNLGVVHMEFPGLVRTRDATLGRFFQIWGKEMRSFGSNMRMTVNGQENTEYENDVMHADDKIELFYD